MSVHLLKYTFILLSTLFLVNCIEVTNSQREARAITLPAGNPKSTLETANKIIAKLQSPSVKTQVESKFTDIPNTILEGISFRSNIGNFSGKKEVFVMVQILHQGEYAKVTDLADELERIGTDEMKILVTP